MFETVNLKEKFQDFQYFEDMKHFVKRIEGHYRKQIKNVVFEKDFFISWQCKSQSVVNIENDVNYIILLWEKEPKNGSLWWSWWKNPQEEIHIHFVSIHRMRDWQLKDCQSFSFFACKYKSMRRSSAWISSGLASSFSPPRFLKQITNGNENQ